jgi:opacity protein-like surface antigen
VKLLSSSLVVLALLVPSAAWAQSTEPEPEPAPAPPPPAPTPPPTTDDDPAPTDDDEPTPAPPRLNPVPAEPAVAPPPPPPPTPPAEEPMSEGRMLVSLYNSGFQWGISPGVIFSGDKVGFALGLHFGYGFDTGPVILVPGVRLAGYFVDPSVYLGMPTAKIIMPIDRFAPFVQGGVGAGYVTAARDIGSESGVAYMAGGGFMIHFTRFAFGAEATYQAIGGTRFKGASIGPILAIGF